MARIVKRPEDRREELITVALSIFSKNGYNETAVSDIVKGAGVAQGTFYYYFKSKEDIIDAIVKSMVREVNEKISLICNDGSKNALEKFASLYDFSLSYVSSQRKFTDFIHDPRNELIHSRVEKSQIPIFTRYYESIIRQGIAEGVFKIDYPHETAVALLCILTSLEHECVNEGFTPENIEKILDSSLSLTERLLNLENGVIKSKMEELR